MSVLSVVLAVQLAACGGLALWWPSRLVMAALAALLLAMTAGAVAAGLR